MNSRLPLSIGGLLVLLTAVLLGWAEYTNWREVVRLEQRLQGLELGSAAAEFQARLLALHGSLKDGGDGGAAAFETEGNRLKSWLQTRQRELTELGEEVAAETELVTRMAAQFDHYLKTARELRSAPSAPAGLRAVQTDLEGLLVVAGEWNRLHRVSLEVEIALAQRSLGTLHALLVGSFFTLVVLAAAVVVLVHRGLVAPLRRQLLASHEVIARQEKLASLGVLAAGVAHEVRNPLTAIKARLFSQQKRLAPGSPEHADALVIKEEIQRLERIVRDVLQFARPGEPVRRRQSALGFLRGIGELMAPTLEKLDVKLTVEPGEALDVWIDSAQMRQVLINLVQNAADSIGQAGRITLRARRGVLPLAPRRTEAVALDVEDTGRGIPSDIQARLFDPFFTTKAAGTGLGLAIAERIAQKHGGSLQFRTQPGRGATFSVVLPAAEPVESSEAAGSPPHPLHAPAP
jgi:signal transduction histidine kinase